VVDFLNEHWPTIEPIIMDTIDIVVGALETAFDLITGLFDALMLLISGDFSGAWRALRDTIIGLLDNLVGNFERVFDLFGKIIPLFFDVGVAIAKAIISGLQTLAGKIGEWLLNELREAVDQLPDPLKRVGSAVFGALGTIRGVAGTALGVGDIAAQRAAAGSDVIGSFATASAGYRDAMMLSRTGRNTEGDQYIINITGIIPDMVAAGEIITEAVKAYKDNGGSTDEMIGAS
jgi:phage-related protein